MHRASEILRLFAMIQTQLLTRPHTEARLRTAHVVPNLCTPWQDRQRNRIEMLDYSLPVNLPGRLLPATSGPDPKLRKFCGVTSETTQSIEAMRSFGPSEAILLDGQPAQNRYSIRPSSIQLATLK